MDQDERKGDPTCILNSPIYFKNLSGALGNRLMQMYKKSAAKTSTAKPE